MIFGYKKTTRPANWTTTPSEVKRRSDLAAKDKALKLIRRYWKRKVDVKSFSPSWNTRPSGITFRPKAVKRIRSQSKTARKASAVYRERARAFVVAADQLGGVCPVFAMVPALRDGFKYGHPISGRITEYHHWAGRGYGGRGPLLLDERLGIGLSRLGHRHVHNHPSWARANGFLAPVGQYNTPVSADAVVVRLENGGIRVLKQHTERGQL